MQQPSSPSPKFDAQDLDLWRVTNGVAIANGRLVINATLLASGGAIVALLSLLGILLSKDAPHSELIPGVTHAILPFAWAMFLSILTAALIYLSSYCYCISAKVVVERRGSQSAGWDRAGDWLGWAGIGIGATAILAFGYGAWSGISLLHALSLGASA